MIRSIVWNGILFVSLIGADLGIISHPAGDFLVNGGVTHIRSLYDPGVSILGVQGKIQKKLDGEQLCWFSSGGSFIATEELLQKNRWTSEFNYDYRHGDHYFINYKVGFDRGYGDGNYRKWYSGSTIGIRMPAPGDSQLEMRGSILVDKDCSGTAPSDPYVLSKIGAVYSWYGRENLKFTQEEIYRTRLSEPNDYMFYSKSGIESKISSRFSMGINYKVGKIGTSLSPTVELDRSLLGSINLKF